MGRLPGLKVKEVEKEFHSRDIASGTLRAIIKQSGMSVDEFVGYLRKRMSN